MKYPLLCLIALCLSLIPGSARDYLIGLSPALPVAQRQTAWKALLDFVLMRLAPGDRLRVFDAAALQPVAEFIIPDDPLFAQPKQRLNRLVQPIERLQSYLSKQPSAPTDARLNAPQFLEMAAAQLRNPGQPLTLVLLGSTFYADGDGAFDFGAEGAYPGDGFLFLSRLESPFSVLGRDTALRGVTVHWAWLEEGFANDAQRNAILRFWHLHVDAQGGVLAGAAADALTILRRAAEGADTPLRTDSPDPEAKAEMILPRFQRAPVSDAPANVPETSAAVSTTEQAPDWLTTTQLATQAPVSMKGKVKVGIRWGEDGGPAAAADLDLYVKPHAQALELSYKRTQTPEGRLWKDWLTAPRVSNGFETVELSQDTDLRQLQVAVNLYRGEVPGGVPCILRLWVAGQVYEAPLRIQAASGNRGGQAAHRANDPHWVVLNIPALIGVGR